MFTKILDLMKKVMKIFKGDELRRRIGVTVSLSSEMMHAIDLWSKLYEGKAPWLSNKVKGLNLSAAISSEMARLVTLEMKSEISGSSRARFLNEQYRQVLNNIRLYTEYACAKSGIVFKPYVVEGKICVNCIQADCFFPTAFDSSGKITGAVFMDQIVYNGKYYTRFEHHEMNKNYTIKNCVFVSRVSSELGHEVSLSEIPEWSLIQPETIINNVKQPLFGFFKIPMANTIDPLSPLGVSVYAKAIDLLQDADKQYSRLLWEFESGERALYVSDTAFKSDKYGKRILPDERLYRTLDTFEDDDLFQDWTPILREENILNGLNAILRKIEYNCGLAYGTLSDVQDTDKTAEEIRASKQRSYATVADIQQALKTALKDLIYGMDVLCTLYQLAPGGSYDVSFEFDDSIVADRKTEFAEKQQLVTAGIMQPWEFRMWYFGESEEDAKRAVSSNTDGFTDPDSFRIINA